MQLAKHSAVAHVTLTHVPAASVTAAPTVSALAALPSLTHLSLPQCGFRSLPQLLPLTALTALSSLSLASNPVQQLSVLCGFVAAFLPHVRQEGGDEAAEHGELLHGVAREREAAQGCQRGQWQQLRKAAEAALWQGEVRQRRQRGERADGRGRSDGGCRHVREGHVRHCRVFCQLHAGHPWVSDWSKHWDLQLCVSDQSLRCTAPLGVRLEQALGPTVACF